MNLSGMLTGSESQKQADMKVCEKFTRCKVSRGVRSSSSAYDYTDMDTRLAVAPEEYRTRYLACLHAKEKLEYGLPGPQVVRGLQVKRVEDKEPNEGTARRAVGYSVPVLKNALISPTKPPRGSSSPTNSSYSSSNSSNMKSSKSAASDAQVLEDKAKARKERAASVAAMKRQQQLEVDKERQGSLGQNPETAINDKENAPHGCTTTVAADVIAAHGIATSAEKERKASARRRVTLSPTTARHLTARLIGGGEEEKKSSLDVSSPAHSEAAAVTNSSTTMKAAPPVEASPARGCAEEKSTEPDSLESGGCDSDIRALLLADSDEKKVVEGEEEEEEEYKTAEEWEAEAEADEAAERLRLLEQQQMMMAALTRMELENQQLMQVVRREMSGTAGSGGSAVGSSGATLEAAASNAGNSVREGPANTAMGGAGLSPADDHTDCQEDACVKKMDVALAKQQAHARLCVRLETAKWRYQYEMVCIQLTEIVALQ